MRQDGRLASQVLRVLNQSSLYVIDTEGVSAPGDYDESTLTFERARIGDELAFFSLGLLQPKGTALISGLSRVYLLPPANRTMFVWY